jgi:hypothetical protein
MTASTNRTMPVGPMGPTDGAALAGQHADPDRAPVSLARQNAEAVMEQPMSTNTEAQTAIADCDEWRRVHSELENPIYDLMRLLRAAEHLQEEDDEDLRSSAKLLVEQAAKMADDLNEKYQRDWPRKGKDSPIEGDALTAKGFILRELDACERRLRETRTQAEAISKEDVDPVLPLVQAVRNEWDRLGEAIDKATEVEDERPDEAESILAAVDRTLDEAMDKLVKTPPTTLAGAREGIAWFAEYDKANIPKTSGEYIRTLARSPVFAA